MRTAEYQAQILDQLVTCGRPMSLREITNNGQLNYHQVASGISALVAKGYVKRIKTGIYEITEAGKIDVLPPEHQVAILKNRITELEMEIRELFTKLAKAGKR